MNLKEELKAFAGQMAKNAPQSVLEIIGEEISKLSENGILKSALKVGDKVPDFELSDSNGNRISLNSLTKKGSVIISFNRGNWCPFCNIEFKHIQNSVPEIKKAGANLVVISPQLPEKSAELIAQNGYDYPILYDMGNKVAERFGIAFTLAEPLRPIHKAFNMDIPAHNGDESYSLPVPATFVVNDENKIIFASVNPNWMERAEISSALKSLN